MTAIPDISWREPSPSEYPRLYAMLSDAYRAADPSFPSDPGFFARYTDHDPHFQPRDWVVGWLGPEPVTALRIFERQLLLPDGSCSRLAGIGNVGTSRAQAGRLLGSHLLAHTVGVLAASGFELSLLYAGRPRFYERAGWKSIHTGWTRLALATPLGVASGRGGEWTDGAAAGWDVLGSLHDEGYAALPGAVRRSREYWERWIGGFALGETRSRLVVAFRGGTPVAYLAGRKTGDGALELIEGYADTANHDALLDLARVLDPGAATLLWPSVPWLDAAFGSLAGRREQVERDAGMVRAIGRGDRENAVPSFRYLLSHLDRF